MAQIRLQTWFTNNFIDIQDINKIYGWPISPIHIGRIYDIIPNLVTQMKETYDENKKSK